MKTLFVTLGSPCPPERGARVRDFQLIRRIAATGETALLALVEDEPAERATAGMRDVCTRVDAVVLRAGDPWTPRAPRPWPLAGRPFLSLAAVSRLRELVDARDPDVVQIEHSLLAPYVSALDPAGRARTVLSMHNVGFRQYATMSRTAASLRERWGFALKAALLARMERRLLPRFDAVVVVSEEERRLLRGIAPGIDPAIVPNGIDTTACRLLEPDPRGGLLFVGNLSYRPNVDAIVHFCAETLPILHRSHPELDVTITGPEPPEEVRRLGRLPHVEVTGRVDDLEPIYRRARLCIAPLRAGGGTRLKILEAMAYGRPVVSTRFGCEGLDVENGREVLLADRPEDFARAIVGALDNPVLCEGLRTRARALVERNYDWQQSAERLQTLHRRIAS